jgi:hypothetical protein
MSVTGESDRNSRNVARNGSTGYFAAIILLAAMVVVRVLFGPVLGSFFIWGLIAIFIAVLIAIYRWRRMSGH